MAAAEGHAAGALGPTATAREKRPAAELGPPASMAPGVGLSAGGMGP